jgi:hypothetical protein
MLEALRPARLDGSTSKATFDSEAVEVDLRHEDRTDWGIWATVGARDAIVGTHYAHEHFFAPKSGDVEERPWTTQIVDFIAEILRGEVEVETTFRGDTPIAVRHFNLGPSGDRQPLVDTGFLVPARLFFWRTKRTTTERLSYQ